MLKIGRLRTSTRRIHTAEMEAARELGGKLFDAVFGNEVRACLRSSLDEAYRQDETGLRLKLRLQEVPELADLPWEFLLDPSHDRFLAQSNQTPIVRYIEMAERIKPLTLNLPLQVLVMISSPADHVRLDVERERSLLQEALRSLSVQGKVRMKFLEKATLATLQRCLREETYHVFHFIGHGGFDKKAEEGVLVLEDEQGRGWQAGAHRIGTLLHDHRSLRLAVLNSCEGARNSRTDPFTGVATTLIRQGVPAVIAMQFEITDDAAITFASEFYTALAEGFPVDAAMAEARKAIYAQPNDVEWGTPVLYMCSSDGVLFNLTQKLVTEKMPPAAAPAKALTKEPEKTPQIKTQTTLSWPLPSEEATSTLQATTKAEEPKPIANVPTPSQFILTRVRKLEHKSKVHTVAFSPDGTMLASGSGGLLWAGDHTVRLWRVSDGKLLYTLEGHKRLVENVSFSPDGTILASGFYDNTVRLWRISDGELLKTLEGHTNSVSSIAFSPDGTILASASHDNTVRLWQLK